MVRVIDEGPDPSVVKLTICESCGAKLEYVPVDVKNYRVSDYTGDSDTYYYVECPKCRNKAHVRGW